MGQNPQGLDDSASTSDPLILEFEFKWHVGVRSAAVITHEAQRFVSEITLTNADGLHMSAKDMMGILLLVAISSKSVAPDGRYPDEGTRFKLSVEGPDSAAAFLAMADLLTCGGEGMVKCPYSGCISSVILISFDRKEIGYGCSKGTWTVSRATGKSASI